MTSDHNTFNKSYNHNQNLLKPNQNQHTSFGKLILANEKSSPGYCKLIL